MSRTGRIFCVLIVTCFVLTAVAAGQGKNLLPNPDFELGYDAEEVPLHWEVFSRSDVAGFTLTTEKAASGKAALLMVDKVNDRSTGLRSARIPAEPGRVYRAEADVWVEAGLAQFYLDFHDASGARIEAKTERARVSTDWQTVVAEATAPPGTVYVSVILYSDIVNVGTIYFDNVRLFDMTPQPAQESPQTSSARDSRRYAVPGTRLEPDQYIAPFDITVAEWENRPPALYPPLPVTDGPDTIVTGPLRVEFTAEGLPAAMAFDRTRGNQPNSAASMLSDLTITVASARPGEEPEPEKLELMEAASGYEVNNSYFTRRLARFAGSEGSERLLDVYTELVTDSMFAYIFPRLYLTPGESTDLITTFRLPGTFRRLTYFEGDMRVQSDLAAPLALKLDADVTKPFLLFERGGMDTGIAFFLPVRPEVRAWYHEHYVAVDVPAVQVDIVPDSEGITVTFSVRGIATTSERPHTFDFYYWTFPVTGRPDLSLYLLQGGMAPRIWSNTQAFAEADVPGFWVPHMPSSGDARMFQALRYFPAEGYSFATPDHFYKGHFMSSPEGAHVWGNQTANYKRLNFSGSMESSGLVYDMAVRHLQLYLDKADDVGIPPFRATAAIWFEHFNGLSHFDLLQNFHFAQAPEYMVRTALHFILTGKPSAEDARAMADVINRTLALLDPDNLDRVPTTLVLPDGSYWYNYFEMETQRVREGLQDEPGFVNNVHVTWLNVMVDAARLNKHLGNDDAYAEWSHYVRKGIDGMIYIFNQDRAWAEHDPNELLYGINWPGPNASYAQYLLSGWLPRVIEFADEELNGYRVDEMVALFRKIMAGRWTAEPQYAAARSSAVTWLDAFLNQQD